jgi:ABC-type branched-subunit amino acid transport system ATPase component
MLLLRKQNPAILLVGRNAEIADKASIIDQGRIVFHGTPEETRATAAVMNAYLGVG